MFSEKTLMITGGTGSFGQTVLKRFLSTNVSQIRIFSRDEKKQEDMRNFFGDDKLKFYIGDVRDKASVLEAMQGVDYVFHAAALKQVPSCEFYPMEAIKTNILGTENVLDAAIATGVQRVVVLSTDKAVYPINAMGLSKALAEKIMVARSRSIPKTGPVICATRYGNVMGSRGSVIPLLIEQIMQRAPLTITDPNMTRFLMTLEDSVDLVLYAFSEAKQGDILVQKAAAATIGDLARALKQLFSSDVPISEIGARHGEKLYESLISREEMAKAVSLGRYFRIPSDNRDLNYKKYVVEGEPSMALYDDYTSHNTERLSEEALLKLLLEVECVKEALT